MFYNLTTVVCRVYWVVIGLRKMFQSKYFSWSRVVHSHWSRSVMHFVCCYGIHPKWFMHRKSQFYLSYRNNKFHENTEKGEKCYYQL